MLANGLKRKLDHDGDGLEEVVRPVASVTLQRQTVLNMSLMKLYGPQLSADLRLQRRVLINNIIHRIHDDLRQEGGLGALFYCAAPPLAATAAPQDHDGHPQAPPPPPSFSILSSSPSGLTAGDSCLTPASLLEDNVFFTLPPSPPSSQLHLQPETPRPPLPPPSPPSPKDSFSSALEEIEELCPSSSRTPLPPPARVTTDVVMKEEEGRDSPEGEDRLAPPPPTLSSPGSFLTDFALDDVLFTDSDASMYDLRPCHSPPSGAPPSKMAPAVMSGYGPVVGGASNQSFKMDLNELDHIMEVLVGS